MAPNSLHPIRTVIANQLESVWCQREPEPHPGHHGRHGVEGPHGRRQAHLPLRPRLLRRGVRTGYGPRAHTRPCALLESLSTHGMHCTHPYTSLPYASPPMYVASHRTHRARTYHAARNARYKHDTHAHKRHDTRTHTTIKHVQASPVPYVIPSQSPCPCSSSISHAHTNHTPQHYPTTHLPRPPPLPHASTLHPTVHPPYHVPRPTCLHNHPYTLPRIPVQPRRQLAKVRLLRHRGPQLPRRRRQPHRQHRPLPRLQQDDRPRPRPRAHQRMV